MPLYGMAIFQRGSLPWLLIVSIAFWNTLAASAGSQQALQDASKPTYSLGQAFEVTCLNRSTTTGEHITDSAGNQLYIPFPTCNETGRPLELEFGIEKETNCTIDITDPLYHLLEFYVHNDAPLTCRVPARPIPSLSSPSTQDQPLSSSSTTSTTPYVPLIFALTGTLQSSHLHISSALNLLLHTAPPAVSPGTIDAATAYATSAAPGVQAQIIIGDRLPLRLSVRWFVGTQLPPNLRPGSSLGLGGHVFWSTAVYCALSAGAATAVCTVWFRGVELPRRLRSYQRESVRGERGGGGYNGYALSGAGYGFGGGGGKRD